MINKNKFIKIILSLSIVSIGTVFLESTPSHAYGFDSQMAYSSGTSINELHNGIRELWNGDQNNRAFYVSATNSIRPVYPGWHILYGEKYYVDENNQWLVSTTKEIGGANWSFGADGTVYEMWKDL